MTKTDANPNEPRYEVHTYTMCEGWINCWTETDEDHVESPVLFLTLEEAKTEIEEFLTGVQAVGSNGAQDACEFYRSEEFRIFDLFRNEYVTT